MITLILRILSRIRSNHNQTNSKKNTQMIHIPIIKALYISKKSTYLPYYYYFNRGLTHHRNLMDRYHPGYFGKKGIRVFHLNKNALHCPVINIDKLWSLVSEETRTKYADNKVKKKINSLLITQKIMHKTLRKTYFLNMQYSEYAR